MPRPLLNAPAEERVLKHLRWCLNAAGKTVTQAYHTTMTARIKTAERRLVQARRRAGLGLRAALAAVTRCTLDP